MTPHNLTPTSRPYLPVLLVLSSAAGAALIYEIVWLQLLQLVIGSTAVSLGVLLGTFMGGMCAGSLLLPRLVSAAAPLEGIRPARAGHRRHRARGLVGMPYVEGLYGVTPARAAWHCAPRGRGRGVPAAAHAAVGRDAAGDCALGRDRPQGVSWLGFFYGGNIAGAVFGCLLAGFYLLRVYDMAMATYVAAALNLTVAAIALALAAASPGHDGRPSSRQASPHAPPAPGPCIWQSLYPGCRRSVLKWSGRVCSRCCSAARSTRSP